MRWQHAGYELFTNHCYFCVAFELSIILEGYYDCCGFGNNCCHERSCPTLCLCCESFLCNSCAISASRMYVMERYQLSSDPCDYRLIRINNCCQILACICNILAIVSARIIFGNFPYGLIRVGLCALRYSSSFSTGSALAVFCFCCLTNYLLPTPPFFR